MADQTPTPQPEVGHLPPVPDQPDGIDEDSDDLPGPDRAAARVGEFVSWYGDGRVYIDRVDDAGTGGPPLYARDLEALRKLADGARGPMGGQPQPDTPTDPDHREANGDPVWRVRVAHSDSRLHLDVVAFTDPDNGPVVVITHGSDWVVLDDIEELVTALRAAEVERGQRQAALDRAEGGGRR